MGKSSGPRPPDPVATANAQGQANAEAVRESARVNQINQRTPFGSVSFEGAVGSPNRTQVTRLGAAEQAQKDLSDQAAVGLGNLGLARLGQIDQGEFNLDGVRQSGELSNRDLSADANKVEQATFDRAQQLLRPEFERRERRFEQRLADQGIPIGSEAFGDAFEQQIADPRREADLAAALESIGAGRGEQSRLLGEERALIGTQNQLRGQDINERLLERNQPANELAAILQGSPAIQAPAPNPVSQFQIAPGDVQGQINSNFQTRSNNRNSALGGLFSLGSALGSAAILSDRRMKSDITTTGAKLGGYDVYRYRYSDGGPFMFGLMADDVPWATEKDGYLTIDVGWF